MANEKNLRVDTPYIVKNHKKLRCGFTTGTCAAAAAKAAATMLLGGIELREVCVETPKGICARFAVEDSCIQSGFVSCSVRKDSGDDPDVTDGIKIMVRVRKANSNAVEVDGGLGVGRITKKGLACPVGSAAINPVPREMIKKEVKAVCKHFGYMGGFHVEVIVPEGEEIAKKTFNSRLGIEGGISILGTSGIVEPMSEAALVDSILLEMDMMRANGLETLVLVPGNYGEDFIKNQTGIPPGAVLKCSNFIGEALDHALDLGFGGVLLVGHVGKMVKLAGGIMNTHSKYADCRMELFAAYAALSGAGKELLDELMASATADGALEILRAAGIIDETMLRVMCRIEFHVLARLQNRMDAGILVFSNAYGKLGQTSRAGELINRLKNGGNE
jgi:cobalt-precorrin-5B (C1)-methyltransferase